jgi:hypothetical protein
MIISPPLVPSHARQANRRISDVQTLDDDWRERDTLAVPQSPATDLASMLLDLRNDGQPNGPRNHGREKGSMSQRHSIGHRLEYHPLEGVATDIGRSAKGNQALYDLHGDAVDIMALPEARTALQGLDVAALFSG